MEKKFYYTHKKKNLQEPKAAGNEHRNSNYQRIETEKRTDQCNHSRDWTVLTSNSNKRLSKNYSRLVLEDVAQDYNELVSNLEGHSSKIGSVSGVRLAAGGCSSLTEYIERSELQHDRLMKQENSEGKVCFVQLLRKRLYYEQLGIPLTCLELIYMGDYECKRQALREGQHKFCQLGQHSGCCNLLDQDRRRMPVDWVASEVQNKTEHNHSESINQSSLARQESKYYRELKNEDIDLKNGKLAQHLPELHELGSYRKSPKYNTPYAEPVTREMPQPRDTKEHKKTGEKLNSYAMDTQSLVETIDSIIGKVHHDSSDDDTSSLGLSICFSYRFQHHKPPPPPPPPPPELRPTTSLSPDEPKRTPSAFPLCEHEDTESCALCEIWIPREYDTKQKPLQLQSKKYNSHDAHDVKGGRQQDTELSSDETCGTHALRNTTKQLYMLSKVCKSYNRLQSGAANKADDLPQQVVGQEEGEKKAKKPNCDSTETLNQVWHKAEHLNVEPLNHPSQSMDFRYVGHMGSPILSKDIADKKIQHVAKLCQEYCKLKPEDRIHSIVHRFKELRQFQNQSIRNYFVKKMINEQYKIRKINLTDLGYYTCPMRKHECARPQNRSLLAHFLTVHLSQPGLVLSELLDGAKLLITFQPRTFQRSRNVCLSIIAFAGPMNNTQTVCNAGLPSKYLKFIGHVPLLVMACRTRLKAAESKGSTPADTSPNAQSRQELNTNVMALWVVSMDLPQPIYVHMTVFNRRLDISRSCIMQVRGLNSSQNADKFISRSTNFLKLTGQDLRLLTNNYSEAIYLELIVRQNTFPLPDS